MLESQYHVRIDIFFGAAMTDIVVLLPALLGILFIAWSLRLAARLLGLRNYVSWKLCFIFSLILFSLALARKASGLVLSDHMPPLLGMLIGVAFSLAIGSWFFGKYAKGPAMHPLGWQTGAKLTACSFALVGLPALALFALGRLLVG
ncbi:hypothetical protein [Massilia suwonensis]|uniref:DUF3397 domain-containing protein n=1 Tax=Massilia suwonensis TaxID=648895 RepID=A0ABW0MNA8_9BURK